MIEATVGLELLFAPLLPPPASAAISLSVLEKKTLTLLLSFLGYKSHASFKRGHLLLWTLLVPPKKENNNNKIKFLANRYFIELFCPIDCNEIFKNY